MSTHHTPGPWYLERDRITVSMGNECVIVGPAPDGATFAEMRANAALIAAAPDLLAALRKIHANAAESAEWIRSVIEPAIAKAEMKQP